MHVFIIVYIYLLIVVNTHENLLDIEGHTCLCSLQCSTEETFVRNDFFSPSIYGELKIFK